LSDHFKQILVTLRSASSWCVLFSTSAAADESSWLAQLLNDFCAAASNSSEPGSTSKYIFSRLIPVYGIYNRFESVLNVPYCAS
jgi:hypothetical protein